MCTYKAAAAFGLQRSYFSAYISFGEQTEFEKSGPEASDEQLTFPWQPGRRRAISGIGGLLVLRLESVSSLSIS